MHPSRSLSSTDAAGTAAMARARCLALGACVLLGACAASPGMHFSAGAPVSAMGPDAIPEVTPITLELVRELRNKAPSPTGRRSLVRPAPAVPDRHRRHHLRGGLGSSGTGLPTQTYSIGAAFEIPTSTGGSNMPGYVVSPQGDIQFPYAGVMRVAGKTANEVRAQMARVLSRVVRDPQMTVRVLGFRSQRVYVDGEVKTPACWRSTMRR